MMDLGKRLAKLEDLTFTPKGHTVRQFAIEGPVNLPDGAAVAFLRECGHEVRGEDLNLIRVFIGAEDGRSVDLPLKDLTRGQGLMTTAAASRLHLQPGRN